MSNEETRLRKDVYSDCWVEARLTSNCRLSRYESSQRPKRAMQMSSRFKLQFKACLCNAWYVLVSDLLSGNSFQAINIGMWIEFDT